MYKLKDKTSKLKIDLNFSDYFSRLSSLPKKLSTQQNQDHCKHKTRLRKNNFL